MTGRTALISAVTNGHTEIVEWLLKDEKIDVNLKDGLRIQIENIYLIFECNRKNSSSIRN